MLLEGLQRFRPTPVYLPVSYRILHADSAFFLQEAHQDLMGNASMQGHSQSFFIHQARQTPVVRVSYGPWSVWQPLPPELLGEPSAPSSPPPASPLFTFKWTVHASIISDQIHQSWPRVQVLFFVVGRKWEDSSSDQLPCISMVAFHETQEVRGTCRLKGQLGLCVAELEPLASWFSPPTVRPGRQKVSEQGQGTPVELYYVVQPTDGRDCSSEDSRNPPSTPVNQQGSTWAFSGRTPLHHIGTVRLVQPLLELKLDRHFMVMVPSKPVRQRETVSAFLALSAGSALQMFSLR